MNSKPDWQRHESDIKSCTKCPGMNCPDLGTLNAPGYGNKNSRIVLIGQSLCGKPCIDSQIPFTGGSGRLLDQAFSKASVLKKELFITNVVKCHPVGNRKSKKHEVNNCTPYLKRELFWISPKVVVCLGKDAWNYFSQSVVKPSSKDFELENNQVTVHFVYHPSYIMKQPKHVREKYIDNLSKIIQSEMA
ncbi:MAG: uracil-DNA glycosylase [Deltaproteobacteria bacterium]|jgi:uracil-DNA glycosylase|nr:uracil-DNA glycosylase [Deltaproteobacteria bacterium]